MGHPGQVSVFGDSGDILTEGDGELAGVVVEFQAVAHLAEIDHLALGGRDFETDGRFSGDGSFDSDRLGGEGEGDVVSEILDFVDADSGSQGDFVAGDRWAVGDFHNVGLNAELFEGVFQNFDVSLDFFGIALLFGFGGDEEVERGEDVAVFWRLGLGVKIEFGLGANTFGRFADNGFLTDGFFCVSLLFGVGVAGEHAKGFVAEGFGVGFFLGNGFPRFRFLVFGFAKGGGDFAQKFAQRKIDAEDKTDGDHGDDGNDFSGAEEGLESPGNDGSEVAARRLHGGVGEKVARLGFGESAEDSEENEGCTPDEVLGAGLGFSGDEADADAAEDDGDDPCSATEEEGEESGEGVADESALAESEADEEDEREGEE